MTQDGGDRHTASKIGGGPFGFMNKVGVGIGGVEDGIRGCGGAGNGKGGIKGGVRREELRPWRISCIWP